MHTYTSSVKADFFSFLPVNPYQPTKLELNGFPIEETSDAHPDFLMEIMEVNEQLAGEVSREELTKMEKDNKGQLWYSQTLLVPHNLPYHTACSNSYKKCSKRSVWIIVKACRYDEPDSELV